MRTEARLLDIEYRERLESFRKRLTAALLALPENPNVKSLGKNCAIISYSQLFGMKVGTHKGAPGAPWSPEYHLFHGTHKEIAERIRDAAPNTIRRVIVGIIRNGKYQKKGGRWAQVHPDAVSQIRTLWEA